MINQGQKVKFQEHDAYINTFTHKELYAIFMSLTQTKNVAEEVLKTNFPSFKTLSSKQQAEKEELLMILTLVKSALEKIKITFNNIGVEI